MSKSLNLCQFIGHVGADPEIRTMNSGDKVANLSLACTETWKDKQTGDRKSNTEWVRVVFFGPLAGVVESYVKKGSLLYVSGKMSTRKWTDQSGQDKYSTEIVLQGPRAVLTLLENKPETNGGGGYSEPNPDAPKEDFRRDDLEDSIPFISRDGVR